MGDTGRAANELTITDWDPVSKQPLFKTAVAAVRLLKSGKGIPAAAPTTTGSHPAVAGVRPTAGGEAALVQQALPLVTVGGGSGRRHHR